MRMRNLTEPTWCAHKTLDGLVLQLVARLQDGGMHLLHRISEFHTEPTENVALPSIILGVDAGLHLLVVNDTHSERFLRFGGIECRTCLLDLGKELLPVAKVLSESVEDVLGFKIPERLELKPLRNIFLEFLDFALDKREGPLERRIREPCQLRQSWRQGVILIL